MLTENIGSDAGKRKIDHYRQTASKHRTARIGLVIPETNHATGKRFMSTTLISTPSSSGQQGRAGYHETPQLLALRKDNDHMRAESITKVLPDSRWIGACLGRAQVALIQGTDSETVARELTKAVRYRSHEAENSLTD